MSNITDENYLQMLFVDEAMVAIEARALDGSSPGVQLYDLGEGTSWDIKALIEAGTLPSTIDYTALTKDNFVIECIAHPSINATGITGLSASETYRVAVSGSAPTKSYVSTTGVLNVSGAGASMVMMTSGFSVVKQANATATMKAWLIA